jgi:BirA family biotin operon repressor/biotin-[acetyl-CoA-carboxylase] ligase
MSLFIGTTFLEFGELPSTNTYATELLSKIKPNEGTVIVAQRQSAGRGQLGSKWASETHLNLTFSLILYPTFISPTAQFSFNQAIALGISDAVRTCLRVYQKPNVAQDDAQKRNEFKQNKVAIKWSNDILINEKKVAGVLIENSLSANKIMNSVVGIGININQTHFEDLPNATSLAAVLGQNIDILEFRQLLFDAIEARYLQLRAGRNLQAPYLQQLYRFGEDACYEIVATQQLIYGRIVGITPEGKMELLTQNGIEAFAVKEIRFL